VSSRPGRDRTHRPRTDPVAALEPDATGTWDVTTETGSTYTFRIAPDGRQTVTRTPAGDAEPLRRDHDELVVHARAGPRATGGLDRTILLGDRMTLVLEPLADGAEFTVRLTSAVTAIVRRAR